MQYRDEGQAVARAVNSGEGKPKPASWQDQYSAGYPEAVTSGADHLTGIDRLLADTTTHAALHAALCSRHYDVLVLRYSGDDKARIKALMALMAVVGTNSGPKSRALSIGAWASPAALKQPPHNWDQQDVSERTLQEWRAQIKKALDKLHGEAMTAAQALLMEKGKIGA